jgi:hypothetical protein
VAAPTNVLNALREYGPFDLLHFSGHGGEGLLAFEDGEGGCSPWTPCACGPSSPRWAGRRRRSLF